MRSPIAIHQNENLAGLAFLRYRWTPQSQQWKHLVAQLQYFVVVHAMDVCLFRARILCHGIQRHCIQPLFHAEQQGFDDGQRQRELEQERGALAGAALHVHCAFQALQDALHYVQAHPPPGDLVISWPWC